MYCYVVNIPILLHFLEDGAMTELQSKSPQRADCVFEKDLDVVGIALELEYSPFFILRFTCMVIFCAGHIVCYVVLAFVQNPEIFQLGNQNQHYISCVHLIVDGIVHVKSVKSDGMSKIRRSSEQGSEVTT